MQHSSHSDVSEYIGLKYNWLTPYIEEDTRKPQVTCRALLQRITTKLSRCAVWTSLTRNSGQQGSVCLWSKLTSSFQGNQKTSILRKVFSHNHHPTFPVGCHIARKIRERRDQKYLRGSIWNQLVLGDLTGWLINPNFIYLFSKS